MSLWLQVTPGDYHDNQTIYSIGYKRYKEGHIPEAYHLLTAVKLHIETTNEIKSRKWLMESIENLMKEIEANYPEATLEAQNHQYSESLPSYQDQQEIHQPSESPSHPHWSVKIINHINPFKLALASLCVVAILLCLGTLSATIPWEVISNTLNSKST